jgi:outer membrane protein assembly factor BamE (lipoprotein component of BamABCDE complex)
MPQGILKDALKPHGVVAVFGETPMQMRNAFLSVLLAVGCVNGCATTGTKLDYGSVKQIQKGKTTRAEVEAKIGVPSSVTLLPDGSRQAWYMFTKTSGDVLMYVPYVNYFAGGTINRKQNLQIIYKEDIVQDYEFTDTSENTEGGMFNQHGTAVNTPSESSSKGE